MNQVENQVTLKMMVTFLVVLCLVSKSITGFAAVRDDKAIEQAWAHKELGDQYFSTDKVSAAVQEYEKALSLNPNLTATLFNLAIAHYQRGDYLKASKTLGKLVRVNPQDVEALYNLACLKLYERDLGSAKYYFEIAKACCDRNLRFKPLIEQGLEFLDHVNAQDLATQDLVFVFLSHGLPPVMVIN